MGWWKIQNTEDIVGDDVFDLMRDATRAVVERYVQEMGRKPTTAEWQHLIEDSLQPDSNADEGTPVDHDGGSMFGEGGRPARIIIERE
jgi:hypothetical protein